MKEAVVIAAWFCECRISVTGVWRTDLKFTWLVDHAMKDYVYIGVRVLAVGFEGDQALVMVKLVLLAFHPASTSLKSSFHVDRL